MISLALGLPATGKSQWCQDYVLAHARSHRFLVVDRADEWRADTHRWRGQKWRGWDSRFAKLARSVGHSFIVDGAPWFLDVPGGRAPQLDELPGSGVIRFGYPWEGEAVAELARELGNCCYVDDELDLVALQSGWPKNPLRDFAHRGRHLPNAAGVVGQVHVLGAARRAQSLHIDVTTLADQVAVFRLRGGRTLERLVEDGILTDELVRVPWSKEELPETEAIVRAPDYHFKLWLTGGGDSYSHTKPY